MNLSSCITQTHKRSKRHAHVSYDHKNVYYYTNLTSHCLRIGNTGELVLQPSSQVLGVGRNLTKLMQ